MSTLKKLISVFTVFTLIFAFCSCMKEELGQAQTTESSATTEKTESNSKNEMATEKETALNKAESTSRKNQQSVEKEEATTAHNFHAPNIEDKTNANSSENVSEPNKTTQTVPATRLPDTVTNDDIKKIETEFLKLVNKERKAQGLAALTPNAELERAAQVRSHEIISVWSHSRPDGTHYYTEINESAYRYMAIGENIGKIVDKNQFTGSDDQIAYICNYLFEMFKASPTHYENMVRPEFKNSGIGISCKTDPATGHPEFFIAHLFGAL